MTLQHIHARIQLAGAQSARIVIAEIARVCTDHRAKRTAERALYEIDDLIAQLQVSAT